MPGGSGQEDSILKSFEKIYNEYSDSIYGFIFRLSNNHEIAEELTQETFYKAFVSFSRFKGNSSVFTWLAAIAKYTYFAYVKKNKLYMEAVSLENIEDFDLHIKADSSTEGDVIKKELYRRMNELINKLPDKYRDAVIYRIYADMSFKQMAETMNISESSAKVLFFRAKNMLKEELKDEFEV